MKPAIFLSAVLAAIIFLFSSAWSVEITSEPLYRGALPERPQARSSLIRNTGELGEAWEALGIGDPLPEVDFTKEAVLLIVTVEGKGGAVEISGVRDTADGAIEVRYIGKTPEPEAGGNKESSFPYLFTKIRPVPDQGTTVRFISEDGANMTAAGTALGQIKSYTNVLGRVEDVPIAEYFPLDKGNVWTYTVKSEGGTGKMTNTVISVSDGWSVFDTFFGVPAVGVKIAPGGEIYVNSKGGMETFYNAEVVTEFPDKGVTTQAGRFDDVMVVSSPEGGDFWFRDVYARGVGLVLHEHKSPKGDAEYELIKATVGGREYPADD